MWKVEKKGLEKQWKIVMAKIDKVTKIEIIVTDEGAQMFFNGNKETLPIAYPELSKVGIILLEFCQQIQKVLASKENSCDDQHEKE